MAENLYLLLNMDDIPVGRGRLQSELGGEQVRVRVLDGQIDAVSELDAVKLVGMTQDMPSLQGAVVRCTGDTVILGSIATGAAIRETLRVKADFDSLIYPRGGIFKGRRRIEFVDLSCGGVAFFCDEPMAVGDGIEIVIPVTPQPLLLNARILRVREKEGRTIYAAKFVDMCYEEEKLVCEAVFAIQLRQHKETDQ